MALLRSSVYATVKPIFTIRSETSGTRQALASSPFTSIVYALRLVVARDFMQLTRAPRSDRDAGSSVPSLSSRALAQDCRDFAAFARSAVTNQLTDAGASEAPCRRHPASGPNPESRSPPQALVAAEIAAHAGTQLRPMPKASGISLCRCRWM